MSLNTNITNLQEILDKVNTLPSAGENLESELDSQSILISEQNAKIAELADVLANKASGGNIKYDTCTISINLRAGTLFGYCMTCFDGEKILQKYNFSTNNLGSITVTDVICGSTFSIIWDTTNGEISTNTSNLVMINSITNKGSMFIAPTQPGTSSLIQVASTGSGGTHNGGSND